MTIRDRENETLERVNLKIARLGLLAAFDDSAVVSRGDRRLRLRRRGDGRHAGDLLTTIDGNGYTFIPPGYRNPNPGMVDPDVLIFSTCPVDAIRHAFEVVPNGAEEWLNDNLDMLEVLDA
jgi:hypothetical protein